MKDGLLTHLQQLVECESPTSDLQACRRVVDLAVKISNEVLGPGAKSLDESGRPIFWLGHPSPKLLMLAHLDTVWPIGSFEPIWQIEDDFVKGPGCYDMKAGFLQGLYALRGIDLNSVALVATTDEETGSLKSRDLIERVSKSAKAVLVLESAIDGKVKIGRKGTSMYSISIHGKAAHAGLEPEKGINATVEMARIVNTLVELENFDLGTTVVPTVLKSGSTTNTVPALATLEVDSRSYTMKEMQRIKEAILNLKPSHPEARIEVTGGVNRPPLEEKSTRKMYERLEMVAKKIGMPPIGAAVVGGASDGNFAGVHTEVLDGLGAVGSGAHALSERVSISDLEPRIRLLSEFIKEVLS